VCFPSFCPHILAIACCLMFCRHLDRLDHGIQLLPLQCKTLIPLPQHCSFAHVASLFAGTWNVLTAACRGGAA
jgi:hypothetical protein